MSLRAGVWPVVPAQTERVARAAFPRGSLAIRMRDELGEWCRDEDFAGLFGVRGRPGLSPAQLLVVTVLQFAENLSDRQAALQVAARIDWKYCLGLPLEYAGFDFSVLSEFRSRLEDGDAVVLPLDLLLARCGQLGLVAAGMRQRTDSTHVLARIRALNRLELAGESVRAALEELAAAVPGWLAGVIDSSWQQVYGRPVEEMRLPDGNKARAELAVRYARDGYYLLEQLDAAGAPAGARDLPAVRVLRTVLIQQFYRDDTQAGTEVTWREEQAKDGPGLPPGRTRVISPYDPDARYGEKRGQHWLGYKCHLSETASDPARDDPATGRPEHPNLITAVATTHAAVPDIKMTGPVHDQLDRRGLTPGEHLADAGYVSADELLAARARGITLTGPLTAASTPQSRSGGYTPDMFTIDWDSRQVTCPQGSTSTTWSPARVNGQDMIQIRFPARHCRPCPARGNCTSSARGRTLGIRPRPVHQAVTAARTEQATSGWQHRYAARAGVEGLMAQASHVTGIRTARYRGLPKTTLEHTLAACALNIIRLDAWWTSSNPERHRTSHLHRLNLTPAA